MTAHPPKRCPLGARPSWPPGPGNPRAARMAALPGEFSSRSPASALPRWRGSHEDRIQLVAPDHRRLTMEEAGHSAVGIGLEEWRTLLDADRHGRRATIRERAAPDAGPRGSLGGALLAEPRMTRVSTRHGADQ